MSSKRRMREERQREAMTRINGAIVSDDGTVIAVTEKHDMRDHPRAVEHCGCGAREGYTYDLTQQAWVCCRCGYPSKGWLEAQQKDHVTERMHRELESMVAKYHKIKAKSDAQPKDQVLLNKKNTARGIIRGLATATSVWIDPHSDDLDQVMEIERTYLNAHAG